MLLLGNEPEAALPKAMYLEYYYYIHFGNIDEQCLLATGLKSRHYLHHASPPVGAISTLWVIKPKLQYKIRQ
jgi:hypothetical protein